MEATLDRPYTGVLEAMSSAGDVRTTWDASREDEVEVARAQFNALIAKGYAAFATNAEGKKGRRVTAFDPTQERLILVPQLQGG